MIGPTSEQNTYYGKTDFVWCDGKSSSLPGIEHQQSITLFKSMVEIVGYSKAIEICKLYKQTIREE